MTTRPATTTEQDAAIEAIRQGAHLHVEALAGTGKTTTLERAAETVRGQGVYVTFNRKNAEEAGARFPAHFECRTAHSLAFQAVGRRYRSRLGRGRLPSSEIAQVLRIGAQRLDLEGERWAGADLADLVWATVQKFIKSPSVRVSKEHLPDSVAADAAETAWEVVAPLARLAWSDLNATKGKLEFTHDTYLKIWQLSRPQLQADVIFFDEAQDADPVMLDVITRQAAQQVYVGDRFQAIYEWRGAVNAMEQVRTSMRRVLTQSFRFGTEIAQVANGYLAALGADLKLEGVSPRPSRVGPIARPDVVLCRGNLAAVTGAKEAMDAGFGAALVGGVDDLIRFADSADRLRSGARPRDPFLRPFRNWESVLTWVNEQPEGAVGELASRVALVERFGARRLCAILRRFVPEDEAEVAFSTAHKAKGREWDSVRIAEDFSEVDVRDPEEARLVYVSVTRAKRALDASHLPAPTCVRPGSNRRTAPRERIAEVEIRSRRASPSASSTPSATSSGAASRGRQKRKHRSRWTPAEDRKLISGFDSGESPSTLAVALGRTEGAVRDRLVKQHGVDWRLLADPATLAAKEQAESLGITNSELAAMVRALGYAPTGRAWKVAKFLRDEDWEIDDAGMELGMEVLADLDPSNEEPYELLKDPLVKAFSPYV